MHNNQLDYLQMLNINNNQASIIGIITTTTATHTTTMNIMTATMTTMISLTATPHLATRTMSRVENTVRTTNSNKNIIMKIMAMKDKRATNKDTNKTTHPGEASTRLLTR